jgi:hypothetical protein
MGRGGVRELDLHAMFKNIRTTPSGRMGDRKIGESVKIEQK